MEKKICPICKKENCTHMEHSQTDYGYSNYSKKESKVKE